MKSTRLYFREHHFKMADALHIFFLATLLIVKAHANSESENGSIVFTDSSSKKLLRLDDGANIPQVIAHDIATYGGLPAPYLNPLTCTYCGMFFLQEKPIRFSFMKILQ